MNGFRHTGKSFNTPLERLQNNLRLYQDNLRGARAGVERYENSVKVALDQINRIKREMYALEKQNGE